MKPLILALLAMSIPCAVRAHSGKPVNESLSEYNVYDWGLDPRGLSDDGPKAQALSNSIPSTGGIIHFPPGIWKFTTPWTVTNDVLIKVDPGALFPSAHGIFVNSQGDGSVIAGGQQRRAFLSYSNNPGNAWASYFTQIIPSEAAVTSYEKGAIYVFTSTSDKSLCTVDSGCSVSKDSVALQASSHINADNPMGHIATAVFGAYVDSQGPQHGDGGATGIEVDLFNTGPEQGSYNSQRSDGSVGGILNGKFGINVVSQGPHTGTSGVIISSSGAGGFYDGFVALSNTVSRCAFSIRNDSVYPSLAPFCVDSVANMNAASFTNAGFETIASYLRVGGSITVNGQQVLNGSGSITALPSDGAAGVLGWRSCIFSNLVCDGIAASTYYQSIMSGTWFSVGSGPAKNNGSTTTPDRSAFFSVNTSGHVATRGMMPTVGECGVRARVSATASDRHGTITPGSGTTTCTVAFASAYGSAPDCALTSWAVSTVPFILSVSTAEMTVGFRRPGKFTYECEQ